MILQETPHEFKMFKVMVSKGDPYVLSGPRLDAVLASENNFIRLPNNEGFNKSFIVSWSLDTEATKENVLKNREKVMEIIAKKH